MKHTYLLLFFVVCISCSQDTKKTSEVTVDPKVLISCEGIGEVKLTDTHADLEKKFGKTAVSEHENNKNGNFTSLWENDPKQINIVWNEAVPPFKTIKYIEAVDGMSPYITTDSIGVGMSLRDLVKKNGSMAVTFTNFYGLDKPGRIRDFSNGEISKNHPCLEGSLEYTGQKPIDATEFKAFQAKEEVKSFDRILERIDVVLSTVRISAKK
ncbi:MAG: hypothetical protein H7Y07_14015 [Pyrinomonadaceae bacterium]|nr:hypothetical protein [Sphingobacteriaceae bacterium]